MTHHYKIAAFSIFEAIIGLVVTAIVVGLTFVVFTLISERLYDFRKENEYVADLNRLSFLLNRDLFQCASVYEEENHVTVFFSNKTEVRYSISGEAFIRSENDYSDTLHVRVSSVQLDTLADKTSTTILQRLRIVAEIHKKQEVMSFFKNIYSDELLNKKIP